MIPCPKQGIRYILKFLLCFTEFINGRGIEPLSTSYHSTHVLWISSRLCQLKIGVEIREFIIFTNLSFIIFPYYSSHKKSGNISFVNMMKYFIIIKNPLIFISLIHEIFHMINTNEIIFHLLYDDNEYDKKSTNISSFTLSFPISFIF